MASSSSSRPLNLEEDAFAEMLFPGEKIALSASPKHYDVFINHRGPDVKETLALELYNSLEKVGIRAFLDCKEKELGDSFLSTIQNAIYSASVQIAIFSRRYAQSVWCLAELALMVRTKRKIIPIFYDVPPSDLRYVEKGVYADSFNSHTKKRRHLDKLDDWKKALRYVSVISGEEFNHNNDNLETLCKNIVSAVRREVERTRALEIARYPTGIEEWVKDFEETCWQKKQKDKVIGIYGMGGCGKTTLVKELFNQKRSEFSASCFLFDVRETKLTSLQTKLLKDLVQENRMFDSIPEGSTYLKSRLASNPFVSFLIVMDDIDHVDQLNALLVTDLLVGNSRSLIIVTTRDERVLIRAEINSRYKMKEMNVQHCTELFCWHAFHQPYPTSGYEDLVESFVKECGGLPLSLQVLGGHVFGSASKHYWKLELDKVRKTLKQDIKQRLRISLESLDKEQKQVFMDIACFFVNKSRHMALRILEGSGWSAEHTLQILMDKCLIEVQVGRTYWNGFDSESIPLLRMHDHIRDLGREIADDELTSPSRLWRSQHLRSQEEKGFENILAEMSGRSFRCLNSIFDLHTALHFRFFLGNLNDCEGTSTALLWLELDSSMLERLDEHENIEGEFISGVSSSHTIPSWIPLQSLQYLKISHGCFRRLWQSDQQVPLQLKDLILDGTNLEEFPNSLGMLSHLENLVLAGRAEWNGTEWNNSNRIQGRFLSESLTILPNLRSLVLRDFTLSGELSFKNRIDSTTIGTSMVSLEKIDVRDVKLISKVSISGQYLVSLKFLHLESMEDLIEVDLGLDAKLNTEGRSEIEELPSSGRQCCLETITVDGCWKLQKIKGIEELQGLKYLHLSAGTVPIWKCIKMWQKVPSQVISLIWESNADEESILQQFNVSSSFIGFDGTVTEIPSNPEAELVVPVTEQTSGIIIFMLIESFYEGKDRRKSLKIPPMDSMVAYMGKGKYIVAVVVTEEEKIIKMQYGMSNWIPMVSDGTIRTGFIVTIQKRSKLKTLALLQHLCSQEVNGLKICPWHFSEQDCTFRVKYFSEVCAGFCSIDIPQSMILSEKIVNHEKKLIVGALYDWSVQFKQITKTIQRKFSSLSKKKKNSKDCENPSTFLLRLEVQFTSRQELAELKNIVQEVVTSVPSPLTVPPRIQLQSLQYLKISGGDFRRLWPSGERTAFQLKELVLDEINLKQFPNSLEMLRHLENLVIAGTRNRRSIRIDGRSFSKSLKKLSNLRSLVLRNLTLSGELSFEDSMVSTILGTPMVSLEKIDITNVRLISKVSISGQYLRSLKSLYLQNLGDLIKVDLGVADTQNHLKDEKSNTEGSSSQIEELPSSGRQCCLETVILYKCRRLQKFNGIEELQGLKYLHLSAGNGWKYMWQGVPSHVTRIIWHSILSRSDSEMKISFKQSIVSSLCQFHSPDVSYTEIPNSPEEELVVPVTEETRAIVIFMLFEHCLPKGWIEFIGNPPIDWMRGWNAVGVVVTEKEKMNKMADWIPSVLRGGINVGSIVTFLKREPATEVHLYCERVLSQCPHEYC